MNHQDSPPGSPPASFDFRDPEEEDEGESSTSPLPDFIPPPPLPPRNPDLAHITDPLKIRRRGIDFYKAHDYHACIRYLVELEARACLSGMDLIWRGLAKGRLEQDRGAISDYTRAIALDSDTHEFAYEFRASTHTRLDENAAAVDDYTLALQVQPDRLGLYTSRAKYLGKLKRFPEALRDSDFVLENTRSVVEDPDSLLPSSSVVPDDLGLADARQQVLVNRALLWTAMLRDDLAREDVVQARKIGGCAASVHFLSDLSVLQLIWENFEEALETLNELIGKLRESRSIQGTAIGLFRKAYCLSQLSNRLFGQARECLLESFETDASYPALIDMVALIPNVAEELVRVLPIFGNTPAAAELRRRLSLHLSCEETFESAVGMMVFEGFGVPVRIVVQKAKRDVFSILVPRHFLV